MQGDLACYARSVVELEWPAMGGGRDRPHPVVEHWSLELQNQNEGLRVRTLREQAAFANLLELRDSRINARRERLAEASPTVTAPVWFILLLGAAVNIAFVLVFIDRRGEAFAAHASLMATITSLVVAGLLLVWFLDHPYENRSGSIKPDEMQAALAIMRDEVPDLPVPCTPAGEPRPA